MTRDLFDRQLRAIRRDRAARIGPELFLFDRAFAECLDRLLDIARPFERVLMVGCPSSDWPVRLREVAANVDVVDPGNVFAMRAGGIQAEEDRFEFGVGVYDLCLAIGTLDTVNDLPLALQLLRRSLRPDSPLIGAIAGGNSLPALRACMIEAGRAEGQVIARTHPRIEAPTLAQLLAAAGFSMPVVDVDRVTLRYSRMADLVQDLRRMGATSVLAERQKPLTRREVMCAAERFLRMGDGNRTEEQVEILHFLAWNQ
ncbi:MAG TPA: SAM-dependent methyltransferase [Sphingomicrobium sp.]|nr:SAM-dependent methyltransferase [Sphingomicrobium sp.]